MSQFSSTVAMSDPERRQRYLWARNTFFDVILDEQHTVGAIALLDQRGGKGDATPLHEYSPSPLRRVLLILFGQRAWLWSICHRCGISTSRRIMRAASELGIDIVDPPPA
jgi:hypothetical protein